MNLTELSPAELTGNVFDRLSRQWMLLSAGTQEKSNFLTASWGALGMLWFQPTATAYVRQSRYTKEFLDREERFCLTFLKDGHRKSLVKAGEITGRGIDKARECGLTPTMVEGLPTFEEAEIIIFCRKLYQQDIDPERMTDAALRQRVYGEEPPHTVYVGGIEKIYKAD